jgi:hypothetical protein
MLKFQSEDSFFLRKDPSKPVFLINGDTASLTVNDQVEIDGLVHTIKGIERFQNSGWTGILVEAHDEV